MRDLGLQIQATRRDADDHNRGLKAQLKGVNAHLNDIDSWKRSVDSQLGHLASLIPRASGTLPGKTEENPRNHITTMDLRSGKKMSELKEKTTDVEKITPELVSDDTNTMPDDTSR